MADLRDLLERRASRYEPSRDLFDRVVHRRRRRDRNRRIATAAMALAVAAAGIGGLVRAFSPGQVPAGDPRNPFLGTWVIRTGGHHPTMVIRTARNEGVAIEIRDNLAPACFLQSPARMRGTGRLEGVGELVVPSLVLACDDGTRPRPSSGPPIYQQPRNLTFIHDPETDELTDNFGSVWARVETDPTVVDFPALRTTFVSPRNGFSIKHPDGAVLTPAEQLWGFSKQVDDGFDVVETGLAAVFKGASTGPGFGAQGSIDERVDEYLSDDHGNLSRGCGVPRSQQAEITIDGWSGRITECANRIEATVVAAGRLYLFALEHDRTDARAVFDAFVDTIDLRPGTAVDGPGLTSTFVSPTYGYSFGYFDRGGLEPAKEPWDPNNRPPVDDVGSYLEQHTDEFDTVETGLGAFFMSASTEIPDGISIDEWADEHLFPGGCGGPRSQQPEITIDGRSGRITECPDEMVATVVAGGRLYLFALFHDGTDAVGARELFDVWVDTIDLTPETATG